MQMKKGVLKTITSIQDAGIQFDCTLRQSNLSLNFFRMVQLKKTTTLFSLKDMFQQKQLLSSSVRQCRVMEAEFIKKTSTKFNFHHFLIAVELKMTEVCVKTFFFKLKSVVVFLKFLTFMPLSRPDGKTLVKTLSPLFQMVLCVFF